MLEKKFENSQKILDLFPVSDKKIELSYTGEQISSDGGLLLLREVENQTGLINGISSCITDIRDLRYVDHSITELITQRIFQIEAGYEDCNDLQRFA
ncbi:MAG: transposase [Mariniphaga sp.]|nr:transposase [Mariniphaga sp.]MDD4426716.1 transposase [Mariniphaga sp.]